MPKAKTKTAKKVVKKAPTPRGFDDTIALLERDRVRLHNMVDTLETERDDIEDKMSEIHDAIDSVESAIYELENLDA